MFCGYSRYQLNLIINSVNRQSVLFDTLVYIDTQVRIGRTRLVVYFVRLQPVASTVLELRLRPLYLSALDRSVLRTNFEVERLAYRRRLGKNDFLITREEARRFDLID